MEDNIKKNKFIMLVGLPASGKSTWAENYKKEHTDEEVYILSSDKIRECVLGDVGNQDYNSLVFDIMRTSAKRLLNSKEEVTVIYDATNVSSKRRKRLLIEISNTMFINNLKVYKQCIYFSTMWRECITRDSERDRTVGKKVVINMRDRLEVPMYHEGWDRIDINYKNNYVGASENCLINKDMRETLLLYKDIDILKDISLEAVQFCYRDKYVEECINYDQKSKWHNNNLDEHMTKAVNYLANYFRNIDKKNNGETREVVPIGELIKVSDHMLDDYYVMTLGRDKEEMINFVCIMMSAMLHDIGKPFVMTTDEEGYQHYYNHANVSGQIAVDYLMKSSFPTDVIIYVVTLIQNHMKMFSANEEEDIFNPQGKTLRNLKEELGEDMYRDLCFLNIADREAHN